MNFDLSVFLSALSSPALMQGAVVTVELTLVSFVLGIGLGLLVALGRSDHRRSVRGAAWTYVWIFRAIPTLVQLVFVWNALPQLMPVLRGQWFTPFIAASIAFSMNEAAYAAEIIRGGMLAIDDGQRQAARALGMSPFRTFRRVIAPQLVRVIIPPIANDFITLLKLTSLVAIISLHELMTNAQAIVSTTYRYAEYYGAAAVYYLVLVSLFMAVQSRVERRFLWSSRATVLVSRGRLRSGVMR